jgi:hypothetical protein
MSEISKSEFQRNATELNQNSPEEGDTARHKQFANLGGVVRKIYDDKDEFGHPIKVAEMFTLEEKIFSAPLDQLMVVRKRKDNNK